MEKLNGHNKKAVARDKRKAFVGSRYTYRRTLHTWVILGCLLSIGGCSSLKSSLITGAATSAVVGATSVLAPGVIVPALAGGATAATVSAVSAATSQTKGEPISVTADTVVNKAPDNFWTLLGKLASTGGWLLILVLIVPMILGWILPGPLERKKKKK
jgi:hypothetical protein